MSDMENTEKTEKKKKADRPEAELLAELEAKKIAYLKRAEAREKAIREQSKFGGRAAVGQQKIVLGSYIWKLAQTDKEVADMVKKLLPKLPEEDRAKLAKFASAIGL